jgi:hypothetical protein
MAERAKTFQGFPRDLRPVSPAQTRRAANLDDAQWTRNHVHQLAQWMDTAFEVPVLGWRFGLDALIGLLPGVGDAATTVVAIYIVGLAAKIGMPRVTVARMALNVAIDMLLGAIPFVGDLFDVWFKANQRNATLLANRLAESPPLARKARAGDWLFVGGVVLALGLLFVGIVAIAALTLAALWKLATG